MSHSRDPRLEMPAVRARYNDETKYQQADIWHRLGMETVGLALKQYWAALKLKSPAMVLNAGAGKRALDVTPATIINLDISEKRVGTLPHSVVATIEAMPLADESIDIIICIGSVINYCDAAASIFEFARVLRLRGNLVLEFDSSFSAELRPQKAFGQSVGIVETFFANQKEVVWVYSRPYISNLLERAGLTVSKVLPIHILSPWALWLSQRPALAAFIGRLDPYAMKIPGLARWASTFVLFCRRDS